MDAGQRIGEWKLIRALGSGTFGEVWLVRHAELGSLAALKLFDREASRRVEVAPLSRLAHLSSRRLAEIIDSGACADGAIYSVSRYIEGPTLSDVLAEQGRLPLPSVRALGVALCEALAALHAAGLVHRDVKPSNVIIPSGTRFDEAVLIDFSLVGVVDHKIGLTQSHVLVGTPAYMAPEQFSASGLSGKTDIFGLGCILYQCSTGEPPFLAQTLPGMALRTLQEPADLKALPESLAPIVSRALQKQPDERPSASLLGSLLSDSAPAPNIAYATAASAPAPPFLTFAEKLSAESYPPRALGSGLRLIALPILLAIGVALSLTHSVATRFALAMFAGALIGLCTFLWIRSRGKARTLNTQSASELARARGRPTESVALAIAELVANCKAEPHAKLLTQSMAFALDEFERATALDPKARMDATLSLLARIFDFEKRISERTVPWYVQHKELVSVVAAIGSMFAVWFGLSRDVLASFGGEPDSLILGCPEAPVRTGTRVHLHVRAGVSTVTWRSDDRVLLVGDSFSFPEDFSAADLTRTVVLTAETHTAPVEAGRCIIDVFTKP